MKINKVHQWDEEKNKWLKANRGISFEHVMAMIVEERVSRGQFSKPVTG